MSGYDNSNTDAKYDAATPSKSNEDRPTTQVTGTATAPAEGAPAPGPKKWSFKLPFFNLNSGAKVATVPLPAVAGLAKAVGSKDSAGTKDPSKFPF